MSFIEVSLSEWDCSKVSVKRPSRNGKAGAEPTVTVLYNDKMPVLVIRSADMSKQFMCMSFKGLQENKVWDAKNLKFLDDWAGDWCISFKICETAEKASPEEKKLMQIFDDIESKVEKVYRQKPSRKAINYSYIKEKDEDTGIEIEVGVDPSKAAYLKAKVGYEATPEAEMIMHQGQKVPSFTLKDRKPKAKFFDLTKDRALMEIKDPVKECQKPMSAIIKVYIGLFKNATGLHITRKLLQCYYKPITIGSSGPDEDIIETYRNQSVAEMVGGDPTY